MNLAYLAAGILGLSGALIHGGLGEAMLVNKIDPAALPHLPKGSGRSSLRLIRAGWHMLTLAFATFGASTLACAGRPGSDACAGAATLVAVTSTGFAAIAVAVPLLAKAPTGLIRHPAPVLLSLVAALVWLGRAAA